MRILQKLNIFYRSSSWQPAEILGKPAKSKKTKNPFDTFFTKTEGWGA